MSDIRLIKPYISFEEVEADFRAIFASGMFTRSQHVEGFRRELAQYTGSKHAFLTTSATTALWLCLKLLQVEPGDEVIVADFSFPATANVVEDLGARPVFADVSLDTFNMLPEELERNISKHTKAVIFVDALGNPTGVHEIAEVCRRHGIPLIEDAACAIGSSERQVRCGKIADLTCFSFHPRKLLTTGEGGAIMTDRDDWARWLEIKLNHGASGMAGFALDFTDYGYNFRLSELQAAMGRVQLRKLDEIVGQRNRIRDAYSAGLADHGYRVQTIAPDVRHNVQSVVFRVPERIDRDGLIRHLRELGIESTIGTYSLSATGYYIKKYRNAQPIAGLLNVNTITLPCYQDVDVSRVIAAIKDF